MFSTVKGFSRQFASGIAMLSLLSSAAVTPAVAQTSAPAAAAMPAKGPKLIIAISIDQFSADLFSEWRGRFTGGLKRMTEGVVFPSGYQSHAATETCPGHSTLLSGIRPARSGIAANDWMGMRNGKFDEIYCIEDETLPGSSHDGYVVSLDHLSADFQTLGDRLKGRPGSATRVFAVSGKDRGSALMAGRNADQVLWYDWRERGFTTYKGRDQADVDRAVPALKKINASITSWIAKPSPVPPLPKACQGRIDGIETPKINFGGGAELGPRTDSADNTAKDFRYSRGFDVATLDLAESMVTANKLGRGTDTDVLAISLSGNDYFGHAYGTEGPEICAQMVSLDARLGKFFATLDKAKIDYAVVLSADHGGYDAPERADRTAYPGADRINTKLSEKDAEAALNDRFNWKGDTLASLGTDFWFTPEVPKSQRKAAGEWLKDWFIKQDDKATRQIAAVFTTADLEAIPVPNGNPALWSVGERMRASFFPGRTADVSVVLRHGVMTIREPGRGYVATHGTPWDYDRRVPILFWWKGVRPFEQPNGVETVDILPTLAGLIGLPITAGSVDGRCLDLDPGPGSTCP